MMRYKPSSFELDESAVPITEIEAFGLDYVLHLHRRSPLSKERSYALRQLLLRTIEENIDTFIKRENDADSSDEGSEPEETLSPPSSDDDYDSGSDVEIDSDDEENVEMTSSAPAKKCIQLEEFPGPSKSFRMEDLFEKYKGVQFSLRRLRKALKAAYPYLEQYTFPKETHRFNTHYLAVQGKRNYMEDQVRVMEFPEELLGCPSLANVSYFGVYDGHGGAAAAKYVLRRLHSRVMGHQAFPKADTPDSIHHITKVLSEAIIGIDGEFNDLSERRGWKSGTTAIVSIVHGNDLISACVGDSRSVLYKGGVPIVMNKAHSPGSPEEKERIENIGGVVVYFAGAWRVNGVIGVSRSIGDPPFRTMLIPDPDTQSFTLAGADYMVMATDGLWDVVKEADVPTIIANARVRAWKKAKLLANIERKKKAKREHLPLEDVPKEPIPAPRVDYAKTLTKEALRRGSRDNISVVFVLFSDLPAVEAASSAAASE